MEVFEAIDTDGDRTLSRGEFDEMPDYIRQRLDCMLADVSGPNMHEYFSSLYNHKDGISGFSAFTQLCLKRKDML